MVDLSQKDELLRAARQASRRHRVHQASLPDLQAKALAPGDVVRLPQTAGLDVEWLLLEPLPGEPGGFVLLETDSADLAGAADFELPAGDSSGHRVVRCRQEAQLPAAALAGARRVDLLPPEALGAVRSLHRAVQEDDFEGSPVGQEEEATEAYRNWIEEVVLPAREALETEAEEILEEDEEQPAPSPIPFPPPQPAPAPWFHWGLAAAIFFAALGLGYGTWTQLRMAEVEANLAEKIRAAQEDLVAEHQEELARRAAERRAAEQALEEQVASARREASQLEGAVADLEGDLAAAKERSFLSSPMIAMVASFRGPVEVTGDPGGSHVLVILSDSELELAVGSRLRASLRRQGSSESLHRTQGLEFQDGAIFLAYPTTVMTPGSYTLRLEADEGDGYRFYRDLILKVPGAGG